MRLLLTFAVSTTVAALWGQGVTSLASETSDFLAGDGESHGASFSADGRYLVFTSRASNLVFGDFNGMPDVFLLDRQTGHIELVSKAFGGGPGNSASSGGTITLDSRYISLYSEASNIVANDQNGVGDGFVYDRESRATRLVTLKSDGTQVTESIGAQISLDGRTVVFATLEPGIVPEDSDELRDVFTRDLETGAVTLQSIAHDGTNVNNHCEFPAISSSGRYVAFASYASNIVEGDDPWFLDVFYRDTLTNRNYKVSRAINGGTANEESNFAAFAADEGSLAFSSAASNLVEVDANGAPDVFVYAMSTRTITIESISTLGTQGDAYSVHPSISADGRYVVFHSGAGNLVQGDTNLRADIFYRDRFMGTTVRITNTEGEQEANLAATYPRISANGRFVTFSSDEGNLIPNDFNLVSDAFEHDVLARAETPSKATLVGGSSLSGSINDLHLRDNVRWQLGPNVASSRSYPIDLILSAQTDISNPSKLMFNFDGSATSNRILVYVSLFNFQVNAYEQVAVALLGTVDRSVISKIFAESSRYVSKSGEVRARLQFKPAWGPAYGWRVFADQIRWVTAP